MPLVDLPRNKLLELRILGKVQAKRLKDLTAAQNRHRTAASPFLLH
jgi:hypothetical protein